jgi:hypothetical protein
MGLPLTRMRQQPTARLARLPSSTSHGYMFGDLSVAEGPNYLIERAPLLRLAKEYRAAIQEVVQQFPATVYVVANPEVIGLDPEAGNRSLRYADKKIARKLIGKHWSRITPPDRPYWLSIPEFQYFTHFNMFWAIPSELIPKFLDIGEDVWRTIYPEGSFNCQVIGPTAADRQRLSEYVTKAFDPQWSIDYLIDSRSFHPKS